MYGFYEDARLVVQGLYKGSMSSKRFCTGVFQTKGWCLSCREPRVILRCCNLHTEFRFVAARGLMNVLRTEDEEGQRIPKSQMMIVKASALVLRLPQD